MAAIETNFDSATGNGIAITSDGEYFYFKDYRLHREAQDRRAIGGNFELELGTRQIS